MEEKALNGHFTYVCLGIPFKDYSKSSLYFYRLQ